MSGFPVSLQQSSIDGVIYIISKIGYRYFPPFFSPFSYVQGILTKRACNILGQPI
jgi:hypothetical protein